MIDLEAFFIYEASRHHIAFIFVPQFRPADGLCGKAGSNEHDKDGRVRGRGTENLIWFQLSAERHADCEQEHGNADGDQACRLALQVGHDKHRNY